MDLWVRDQPGLQSEIQDSQDHTQKINRKKPKVPLRAETLFRLIDICETNTCILTQVDSKGQGYVLSIKQ